MASLGARGDTARELSTFLGLTYPPDTLAHEIYRDHIAKFNSASQVNVHTANALFVNPGISLKQQYIRDARKYCMAEVANFNLSAVGGPERQIISYVEEQTYGMMKDLLSPGSVNASTVAVLLNTIAFNGTWQQPFSESKTKTRDFQKEDGTKSQVEMMNDSRNVNIRRDVLGADVVELPYLGDRFSLYIVQPAAVDGITDLESALAQPENVEQLFQGLTRRHVKLSVPKFKIQSKSVLNTALQQLGLKKAFDPSHANFQGISSSARFLIGEVLHKVAIKGLETGTMTAVATAIVFTEISGSEKFTADQPSLLFLKDKDTRRTFFYGEFLG